MTSASERTSPPPTPAIDALLARLRARVTRQVWLHGLGTAAAGTALWLLVAFGLDWWLHLPGPIRVFHLTVLALVPAWILWHELVRPLLLVHGLADDNVVAAHTLRLSSALLAAGRPHEVLPLVGVTHMTPQEQIAENLLLHELDFLRRALGVGTVSGSGSSYG